MVRFFSLLLFTLTLTLTHAYPQYRYQQQRSSFLSSLRSHTLIQLSSRHLPSAHTSALSSRFWSFSTSPFSTRKTYIPSSYVNDQPIQHMTVEHPQYQHVEMTLNGMNVKMKLERNDDIFAPGYGETEQTYINGIRQDHLDITHEAERCHYRGTIENTQHDNHMIILHTCYQGYSGMMMLGDEMYLVEPAHRHMDTMSFNAHLETLAADVNPFSVHILARASDMITPDFVCGVGLEDATSFEQQAQHTFQTLSHAAQEGNLQHAIKHMMEDVTYKNQLKSFKTKAVNQKYIELLVVNDYTRINSATFGGDTKAVATSSAQIVSYMDGYYRKQGFTPAMAVVLVGQIFFKTADPYTVTFGNCATCGTNEVDVQQLLSLFNTWRSSPTNTKPYTAFDCGQLFSGLKFNGPILGYAGVRAMCKPVQSGGIAQMTNSDAFNALIGAHEMGHNLGMEHDTGSTADCPETGFIMTAIVNFAQPPSKFSKCSSDYLTGYVNDAYSPQTCMDNTPTAIWGDASCGNGFVESGEQCDCGASDCSRTANPCCNGATCRFHPNATCSETSACCKNCQLISAASKTVCRTQSTSCDVAEMCNGVDEACPPNYGLGAGTPCKEQGYPDGMCYGGTCSSHLRSCRETGSTFKGAPYDQCPQQASLNNNNFCGTMYCANNPSYCTFFHVAGQIAYIPDGVPCGDGQQCYHQQCVSSATLNTQFSWKTTEWTSCTSCDQIQTRNISCILITGKDPISGKATGTIASEYYCTPSARPSTSQSCINYEIGCTPQDESTANGDINVFGYKIEKNTVLFSSLGAVSLFFIILACCYQAVTHGQIDEFIRPKYDQASPFNKT